MCAAAPAQSLRIQRIASFKSSLVASCLPATGTTNTITLSPVGTSADSIVAVQIKYPGAVMRFGNTSTIALVGQGFGGKGILHIFTRDTAGAWSLHGTYTTTNAADFVGVGYSAATQRLYLLDGVNKKVLWASYVVGATPPTAWTTLATESQAPILGSVSDGQMWLASGQDGAEPTLYIRSASPEEMGGGWTDMYTIKHAVSGPVLGLIPGERNRAAYMDDSSLAGLKAGAPSLAVTGPVGALVEVLNLDDYYSPVSIGSAPTDSAGKATVMVSPLVFGSVYGLRTNLLAQPVGPFASCVNKWGAPDSLGTGVSIRLLPDLGILSYVGNQAFAVPIFLDFDVNQVTVPTTYNVTLIVGTVTDPIVDVDPPHGRYVLLGSSAFTATAEIFKKEYPGFGRVSLPMPNDPNLANAEVRYQWWVTLSPTDVRISDIQGVLIRGSAWVPPGAEAFFGSGLGQALLGAGSGGQKTTSKKTARKVWHPKPLNKTNSDLVVRKWLKSLKGRSPIPWKDPIIKAKLFKSIQAGGSKR